MKRILPALVACALILAGAATASVTAVSAKAQRIESDGELERQVLLAINDVRRQHGLQTVRLDPGLGSAAREHSRSMAEHGFFAHTSWDGSAFWTRLEAVYKQVKGRSWTAGENLAWASPSLSAQEVVKLWMHSSPHRENLLARKWHDIGLGTVHATAAPGAYHGLDVTIVTADFGAR